MDWTTKSTCGWALAVVVLITALATGTARADDRQLQRGAYLINSIVACGNCHTPKGPDGHALPDQELSGGFVIDLPVFHAVAPNITPDNDTGIGNWTDEQIVNAIRNGKRPDGTTIGPPMPIGFYGNMSDSDVLAIVAYLRSVKPINHKVEKSTFNVPLPESYGATVTHVTDVAADVRWRMASISRTLAIAWNATRRWSGANWMRRDQEQAGVNCQHFRLAS
jgi:mono/diheme cytochrome c family protein